MVKIQFKGWVDGSGYVREQDLQSINENKFMQVFSENNVKSCSRLCNLTHIGEITVIKQEG